MIEVNKELKNKIDKAWNKEFENKIDEAWNYYYNKLTSEPAGYSDKEWNDTKSFYREMYGVTRVTDGINNKDIINEIEPVPEGYRRGTSKVTVRCIETGEIYNSLTEAAKANNNSIQNIHNALKNNSATNGLHYKKVY